MPLLLIVLLLLAENPLGPACRHDRRRTGRATDFTRRRRDCCIPPPLSTTTTTTTTDDEKSPLPPVAAGMP